MNLDKRDILTLALVVIAVSSVVVGGASTANYFQFYNALGKLQLNLTIAKADWNGTVIDSLANFTVVNPTGYTGLRLKLFQGTYDIREVNGTLQAKFGSMPFSGTKGPLNPGSLMVIAIPFKASGIVAIPINQLLEEGGKVEFVFRVDLILSTFLDKASGISAGYECTGTIGPATCEQLSVALLTSSEEGTGGGGGGGGV